MAIKKAPKARTKGRIGAVEAYNILLQRQINEDHRIINFSAVFLTAHSFLFLGFAMLSSSNPGSPFVILSSLNPGSPFVILSSLNPGSPFEALRIVLAIAGMLLAFWLFHLNLSANNALHFWHSAQQKIEETAPQFFYMRDKEITPHIHGRQATRGQMELRQDFGKWVFAPTKGSHISPSKLLQLAWLRPILQYYLPATLGVLWVTALITVFVG